MLPAQVSYWTLQETTRHNKEMERLTGEEIQEKVRHNKQDEFVRVGTLSETTRNNLYNNKQGDISLGLTSKDAATRRFAAESNREVGLANAYAAQTQAAAAMKNAQTNAAIGESTVALNTTKAKQEAMTGYSTRKLNEARRTESLERAANIAKETEYADFYAGMKGLGQLLPLIGGL